MMTIKKMTINKNMHEMMKKNNATIWK